MMLKTKTVLLSFMAAALMATNVWALSPPVPMVEVHVKAGQIQKSPAIPQDDVLVSYQGVIHEAPITVKAIEGANNKSADNLIAKMIEVNSKGNPIAMASIFLPAERAKVMDSYQDPKVLKPNMGFFRQVTGAAIHGYAVHENVVYLLVTFYGHSERKLVVPAVRTDKGYFLTNAMANPSTLAELTAAYMHDQIKTLAPFN